MICMDVTTFTVQLTLDRKTAGTASQLRGFFATKFQEYVHLHHHKPDGFVYQYPLIQYKMLSGVPTVVGINEGAEVLVEIFNEYDTLDLGSEKYRICEKQVSYKVEKVGWTETPVYYRFLTPWVALNQENYMRYYGMQNSLERSTFLGKTLVGNLLSFSKTIGYTVPDRLVCGVSVKPVKVSLKGVHLMGFSGSFRVNFEIPDLLGIGKSVSRGMGTVKRGDVSDAARH